MIADKLVDDRHSQTSAAAGRTERFEQPLTLFAAHSLSGVGKDNTDLAERVDFPTAGNWGVQVDLDSQKPKLKGVSLGTIISLLFSLRQTSAARAMRVSEEPQATAERVPMLQGMTTMALKRCDPLAIAEAKSLDW